MSLVVSLQQREIPPRTESGGSVDYDWPFSVDRCEVVREQENIRIYFWRDGVKEIGPGLTIPSAIAPDVGTAIALLVASEKERIEIDVPAA